MPLRTPSRPNFPQLLLLLALSTIARAAASQPPPCTAQNRTVGLPIHIRLLFAGAAPIFMREPSWTPVSERAFLDELSATVRHLSAAPLDDASPLAAHLPPPLRDLCSVVEYAHTYELAVARSGVVAALDRILSAALDRSRTMFAPGTEVADEFWRVLSSEVNFRPSDGPGVYNLLVYNAASVAPQRGYQSEPGAPVGTLGVASEKRFAFLDVGAKPHFLDNSGTSTLGELLMVSSRTPATYAAKLHGIAASLFTPPASENMRRFPHESRLLFSLRLVDVSAVIGRKPGIAGDSLTNKTIGATFNSRVFLSLMRSVFHDPVAPEKQVSVEVVTADMADDARMAMAVTRAFSMKGLEMVLDSDHLLHDIVENRTERSGYFVDSSFVAHVPLFLFSFADDSRITHFETGEELRAKVVGKQSVFMVENRLRDAVDDHTSVTSEAAKEALELLCGLSKDSLSHMNSGNGTVPLLLRDIMRRNILRQELDWSESSAARKAVELLNFEGLDSRLIPHEQGSAIAEGRKAVRKYLELLHSTWEKAGATLSVTNVESVTAELMQKSKYLADKLHDEICNQPLPEEIMLKAEAELEGEESDTKSGIRPIWFYLTRIHLPMALGIMLGAYLHMREKQKARARGTALGEIPVISPRHNADTPSTGIWFSTLTSSDKSKVH